MNLNQIGGMFLLASIDEFLLNDNIDLTINNSINKKFFSLSFIGNAGYNNKEKAALYLYGFDENLLPIYAKTFEINEALNDIGYTKCDIDNDGNFFTLLDFPKTGKKKKKNENRKFVLYTFYKANENMLEYDISKPGIEIDDLGFVINNISKQVNIIGFYAIEDEINNSGYFYQTIDLKTTAVQVNVIENIL